MIETLNTVIIQSNLVWENPEQNRVNFLTKINQLEGAVDLIVLPEMFTSGFTMQPSTVAETMSGQSIKWMLRIAEEKQTAVTGSLVIAEENKYFNRLVFVHPNGKIETYDKRHAFTLAGEEKVYTKGEALLTIEYKGFKIRPNICYDLRFPVWSRNNDAYDVLLYVANWPKSRISAWDTLLKARAIENMAYCIGVNRVGVDANGLQYSGHSTVYDVLGEQISNLSLNVEGVEQVLLTKNHIETTRNKFRFLNDKDDFSLK